MNATGDFASTHWSLVLAAGERGNVESSRALEQLCSAYWPPLYAYVRRRVRDVHEAQDLTQAFFERLLEKRYLAQADPERGRFRAFLITALKHFLSNEWKKARAEKRGGGQTVLPFDFASQDSADGGFTDNLTPERLYERQWAITLLNRVINRVQREMERDGKGRHFQALKDYIGGPGGSSYADAATALGMTESAARMAASRLRTRYRELLREEIAHTVSTPEEVDDEVRHLFDTFAD
jgi:RNA polymerase sigma-70 factor (ECF subfamily)